MNKGKIIQVMGPVVDVAFENGNLPHIQDALTVMNNGKRCVMEVAQHIGGDVVRCIMLASSEGLYKDMEVEATGQGIAVPVGEKTLGRLFNVLGDTLDGGESLEGEEKWVIHRDPPSFADQSPVVEMLETGIKVIDLLAPYAKGGKIGLFGGAGVGKTVLIMELINNAVNNACTILFFISIPLILFLYLNYPYYTFIAYYILQVISMYISCFVILL